MNIFKEFSNLFKKSQERSVDEENPFHTFWMAGFECTDQLNAFGNRVDFLNITSHLNRIDEDYKNLASLNIKTVREGIRWSQVEKTPYQYDWSTVAIMIKAGKKHNIQQVWDICHFGFPTDLTPLHPMFARRFAALCVAFVTFYRSIDHQSILIITPINEVSFLSWLGGDVRGTSPYCVGQGWEVKYKLMQAYIEGVAALKKTDPSIRILTTEPLINIVGDGNSTPFENEIVKLKDEEQFQITDILSGLICPELGGKPEYLDILGYNYYFNNQWVLSTNEFLEWKNDIEDDRFVPLNKLLQKAYDRYKCPIVLTETSHPKQDRPKWIAMIANECAIAIQHKIKLWGVCWYPIIDRPDWDNLEDWHKSGIWDINCLESKERILHTPTSVAFIQAQQTISMLNNKLQNY